MKWPLNISHVLDFISSYDKIQPIEWRKTLPKMLIFWEKELQNSEIDKNEISALDLTEMWYGLETMAGDY